MFVLREVKLFHDAHNIIHGGIVKINTIIVPDGFGYNFIVFYGILCCSFVSINKASDPQFGAPEIAYSYN